MQQATDEIEFFRAQVASRMRMVRKAGDVTQDQAAEALGISPRSYKDYELSKRSVPIEVLIKFCLVFKISTDAILTGGRGTSSVGDRDDGMIKDVAVGILQVFGSSKDTAEIEKQVKLAGYAWNNARAKGSSFAKELQQVSELLV